MKILLTRPKLKENNKLKEELQNEFKIQVDILEIVKIKPIYSALKQAILNIDKYDYIGFTSQNSVSFFFNYLTKKNINLNLKNKKWIAIGPQTAKKLQKIVNQTILIPPKYDTQNLQIFLKSINQKCLLLRSKLAIKINLPNVKEIYIYTLEPILKLKSNFLLQKPYDYLILTSSFITKIFFENYTNIQANFFVPIGPTTYKELLKYVDKTRIIQYPENYTIKDTLNKIANIHNKTQ